MHHVLVFSAHYILKSSFYMRKKDPERLNYVLQVAQLLGCTFGVQCRAALLTPKAPEIQALAMESLNPGREGKGNPTQCAISCLQKAKP